MQPQTPLVSIIIPCYNQAHYLKECLDSVFAQSYQNFEVVIVNDGSTNPDTTAILNKLTYPKLTIIHQENKGLSTARNIAIQNAKGKYILPLDADDKIAPAFLEKAVQILEENENIGIVSGLTEFFGVKTGLFQLPPYQFPVILKQNMLVCSCLFRRADWQAVGGYNANMKYGLEDWDFWLSLIELNREVYQLNEMCLYYRKHHISMTTQLEKNKILMFEQIIKNHPALYNAYPIYKNKLLEIKTKKYKIKRLTIKLVCLITPVQSWRKKLRSYYKG